MRRYKSEPLPIGLACARHYPWATIPREAVVNCRKIPEAITLVQIGDMLCQFRRGEECVLAVKQQRVGATAGHPPSVVVLIDREHAAKGPFDKLGVHRVTSVTVVTPLSCALPLWGVFLIISREFGQRIFNGPDDANLI